jgi:hypothetical protein
MKFKVTNWAEYDAGLGQRGSLTLWITSQAVEGWAGRRRKTRGGQLRYSDLAIETALTLGLVFGLRLRQTEGFLSSVLALMGLDLPAPDHTTLSRRARTWSPPTRRSNRQALPDRPLHVLVDSTGLEVYGAGQWLEEKHGVKSRWRWRKLHLALDADGGEIIAHVVTDQDAGDASQVEALLDQIDDPHPASSRPMAPMTAIQPMTPSPSIAAGAAVVIPPRANAAERPDTDLSCQRDRHIAAINADGRMKWQVATDYGERSLVETAIGRYKSIIGHGLKARSFAAQRTEVAIGCAILNRKLACARPKSVRCVTATA